MPEENRKPVVVRFDHDPVVLRVDEMVNGEVGKVAKLVGEIPLVRGINQIDADLWTAWKANNKDSAMAALIHEEKNDDEGKEPAAD